MIGKIWLIFMLMFCNFFTIAFAEEFAGEKVLNGEIITHEQCEQKNNAVWVSVDGIGECIRYWHAGIENDNPFAIFYTHGDRIWGGKLVAYKDNNDISQLAGVEKTYKSTGVPIIKISRPGTYGSSGDHNNRRQIRELKLMESAMRKIIKIHNIKNFAITGQSGGGTVAAYLMTKFPNAKCIVLHSSALSLDALKRGGQVNGYAYQSQGIYDPIKHIKDIKKNRNRKIFIIGDKRDKYALINNQTDFFVELLTEGYNVTFIPGKGRPKGFHSLDNTGQHVAAWCLQGLSIQEIKHRVMTGFVQY